MTGPNFLNKFFSKNAKRNITEDTKNIHFISDTDFPSNAALENKHLRILMIDDNPFLRDSTRIYLENLGMTVECAENGQVGLTLLTNNPQQFDIVLMDIEMPVMGGIETAKKIREADQTFSSEIPIVAVTGSMFTDDPKKPLFHSYIKKPFVMEHLVFLIKKTLVLKNMNINRD